MRFILLISFLAASLSLPAQTRFTVRAGLAWHNQLSESNIRFLAPPSRLSNPPYWQVQAFDKKGSYGTGLGLLLDAGYAVTDRWGFGLSARHILQPTEHNRVASYPNYFPQSTTSFLTRRAEKPWLLEPGLRFFSDLRETVEFQASAGVIIPLRHSIRSTTLTLDTNLSAYWQTDATMNTRFGLGLFGSVGLTVHLPKSFEIFAKTGLGLLSLKAKDETVHTVIGPGGSSLTPIFDVAELQTEYIDIVSPQMPSVPTQPRQRTTYSVPFNYWTVDIGFGWGVGQR